MWIGTFHATCARLLRRYADVVGLTRSFTIFDDDDQVKLVEKLLKEHGLDDQVSPRTVLGRIDRAKNRNEDPRKLKVGIYDDVIEQIYPLYQAQLAKENAVDFNDLLLKVLDLFDGGAKRRPPSSSGSPTDPAGEATGRALRTRFRHVLVDEF